MRPPSERAFFQFDVVRTDTSGGCGDEGEFDCDETGWNGGIYNLGRPFVTTEGFGGASRVGSRVSLSSASDS